MMQLNYNPEDANRCNDCGNEVSKDFIRVFGVDGEIEMCPECSTYREMKTGAV